MKTILLFTTLIVLFFQTNVKSQSVGDYNKILLQSKSENKKVMMFFTNKGCKPCMKMKKEVFTDSEVSKYFNDNFLFYYCDTDTKEGGILRDRYNIYGLPTHIVINHKEEIQLRDLGGMEKDVYLKVLKDVHVAPMKENPKKPLSKDIKYLYVFSLKKDAASKKFKKEVLQDTLLRKNIEKNFIIKKITIDDWYSKKFIKENHSKYFEGNTPIILITDLEFTLFSRFSGNIEKSKFVDFINNQELSYKKSEYSDAMLLKKEIDNQ